MGLLLSIVVPVYNIQDYITCCLDSCLNQDLPPTDYEIIAVDDGSTDHSAEIIHQYMDKYPNLRYVYQENQGLSGARNTGIVHAQGEYIWFVDGDDQIRNNCLHELSVLSSKNNCDILTFDFSTNGDPGYHAAVNFADSVISGLDFINYYKCTISAWRHLYKRNFLLSKGLVFTKGLLHEDGEFNLRAFSLANRVLYHPHAYYYYDTTRSGSITHGKYNARMDSMIQIVVLIDTFFHQQNIPLEYSSVFSLILFKNCLLPAFRMLGHPGVSFYSIQNNYKLIRRTVWDVHGYNQWKCILLFPSTIFCVFLKTAYCIYSLAKRIKA